MPVKNEQRFLSRAMRSILRQTMPDFEFVIIDDGSTDATPRILHHFASKDSRIRILKNEAEPGVTNALNFGLEHCRSDLVARMDADDVSHRRRFEHQLAEFERNPDLVVLGTWGLRVNERGVPIGRLRLGPPSREAYRKYVEARNVFYITHPSVMMRKEAIDAVGGYPTEYRVGQDAALFTRMSHIGEVYVLPKLLTLVTIRRGSVSSEKMLMQQYLADRLTEEEKRQEVFASFEEYLTSRREAKSAAAYTQWEQDILAAVARRRFGRAVAVGSFKEAAGILRESGMAADLVVSTTRRMLRGV